MLPVYKFTFGNNVQVFGVVTGDGSVTLGQTFFFLVTFLLIVHVLFFVLYFIINSDLGPTRQN